MEEWLSRIHAKSVGRDVDKQLGVGLDARLETALDETVENVAPEKAHMILLPVGLNPGHFTFDPRILPR